MVPSWADQLLLRLLMEQFDTLPIQCRLIEHMHETLFVVGIISILFSLCPCVHPCVHPSVTFCFFNILKSHCWIFIKPCKHVQICKTNTLDKKIRARGQFN